MKINGERFYLWLAVDHEGEVLECYVTKRCNKAAASANVSLYGDMCAVQRYPWAPTVEPPSAPPLEPSNLAKVRRFETAPISIPVFS